MTFRVDGVSASYPQRRRSYATVVTEWASWVPAVSSVVWIHPHYALDASRDRGDSSADRPRKGSRGRVCTWRAPGNGIAKKVEAHTACELVSETVEGWCTHI